MDDAPKTPPRGLIPRMVNLFLNSQLSIIFVVLALSMGVSAILLTPREEEPQIVVPMADVFVQAPGAGAREIEQLVSTPLEKLLWQIDGVEYVYSTSREDMAVVTVRFFVGEDRERSLVKLHNKIRMNIDTVPPIVKGWVIKPVEIDDVPIVNLTLYSDQYGDYELRRVSEELLTRLTEVENISRSEIVAGRAREIRILLDPERMHGRNLSFMQVLGALNGADASVHAGSFSRANREYNVACNAFLASAKEVENLLVGARQGKPVYIRDIAEVLDGPHEPHHYSRIGFSRFFLERQTGHPAANMKPLGASPSERTAGYPAVTVALAKKRGTNAVWVARDVLQKLEELRPAVIPDGVHVEVTRNYGRTAQNKVSDLLNSLFFAILTVVLLLAITLGRKEALIVAVAVPISFSFALFVNYLFGYTINRVTLFALILSLGLVVDDPITNVDNIQRHIFMKKKGPREATLYAVGEVLPPVIVSTLAIIISFTPLFFITGMMGPYMAPMAANVPLTVTASTLCALTIVPWLSYQLLKRSVSPGGSGQDTEGRDVTPDWIRHGYRRVVGPFMESRLKRMLLLAFILAALIGSLSLALFRQVPLKMLPFDNKNEFQLVLDMPEGTPLEATDRVVRHFEDYLRGVPEVTNFVSFTGTSSPMDFNGMVRHYYLRKGGNLADIRINLASKEEREMQSHEIMLRLRNDLERIAREEEMRLKIVEVPPGPPVLSTVVAEIYGDPSKQYRDLLSAAEGVRDIMREEPFVVDIDDTSETPRSRIQFFLDKEKAALHGISAEEVTRALRIALSGAAPASIHRETERHTLPVRVILPRAKRSGDSELGRIALMGRDGHMVTLSEIGTFSMRPEEQPVYHKNLRRVVYVTAEVAGRAPGEAILDMHRRIENRNPLARGIQVEWAGEGEWQITLRVFRDLGIAFGAALLGMYILLTVQTGSFLVPLILLMAVPLTLLGIMPGFWLLNAITNRPIGGFENPVFFTATSMIGMIALGGIVLRNATVLIDFVRNALERGESLRESILQSGAVRLRPIVLTAMTTALGAWPITLDPVFSGLAWALIFGLFASTAFTLVVVPVAYYAFYRKKSPP